MVTYEKISQKVSLQQKTKNTRDNSLKFKRKEI